MKSDLAVAAHSRIDDYRRRATEMQRPDVDAGIERGAYHGRLDPMAALLSPGFGNQEVDIRLFDAEYLRPLRAIVQEFRPRTRLAGAVLHA